MPAQLICQTCSTPFTTRQSRATFCSPTCHYQYSTIVFPERFWSHVQKTDTCWFWVGALYSNGYGHVGSRGKNLLTHRVAWELTYGDIPLKQVVMHICDTPACCRPDHLALGTQQDNMCDMSRKGRSGAHTHPENMACGEQKSNAKLTETKVRTIREMHANSTHELKEIAFIFGVSKSLIEKVVSRRAWAHI